MPATKLCEVCGREFSRPVDCSPKRWAKRRACSNTCGYELGKRARQAWPEPVLRQAGEARRQGYGWAEIWRMLADGRSTAEAMRNAYQQWTFKQRHRSKAETKPEPEMNEGTAAALILSRPPARLAAQLAQLPACELRLVSWPLDSVGAPPWTR